MKLLEVLEASATSAVQKMNFEEVIENLLLFDAAFVSSGHLSGISPKQLWGFLDRVYSMPANAGLRDREVLLSSESRIAMGRLVGEMENAKRSGGVAS